jgi:hypothetical protein
MRLCVLAGPPRWNHTAVSVFAVPYWKIFVFGGNSGNLNDGEVNPQVRPGIPSPGFVHIQRFMQIA